MAFLKEFLGSPRTSPSRSDLSTASNQAEELDPNASILSPRNFLRMLSSGFDQLRSGASPPSANNYA